ncbi:MAG: ABC transporter ATP-binding protein [Firmicutes bacterium]|nr:ABC transporter ATP-binding protein [Bacillota bacterium]
MPPRAQGPKTFGAGGGKPQDAKATLLRLGRYLYQYKWLFLAAILLSMTSNVFALVGPMLSGYAIDAIEFGQGHVDFESVFYYAGWMILFYIASALLSYALSVLMMYTTQKIVGRMRKDVFEKLMKLPVGYYDRHLTGDILSRMSYDIDTINVSLSTDLVQIFSSVITVVGSFIMMVVISPYLVIVMLITIPLSILYTKRTAKRLRPLYVARSEKLGAMNSYVEEMISGQKTIRAYAQEKVVSDKFDTINQAGADAYYNAEYNAAVMGPTVNFINNLSLALVTVFGAMLFLLGKLSMGNIGSFVQYSRKFSSPINEAANILGELQSACAAAERVFRLLDEEEEPADVPGAITPDHVEGDVVLENVAFRYLPDVPVIHDFSMEAKPGNIIAIVGPTGAGKTTIINLLMRFYDINDGSIRLDGEEISHLTRSGLRKCFAMVLQDTWLFDGTIFENIAYGREGATMDEVVAAAKAARIHSYIKRLPQGYNTMINGDGVNISKGQKQLLTIARAFLLDAKILILDEATSNVDTRTEIQIQSAMQRLMKGKTCFVIAHRLSTIRNADLILVMRNGNVIEQGNHEQLIREKGFYYQLYNSQYE